MQGKDQGGSDTSDQPMSTLHSCMFIYNFLTSINIYIYIYHRCSNLGSGQGSRIPKNQSILLNNLITLIEQSLCPQN